LQGPNQVSSFVLFFQSKGAYNAFCLSRLLSLVVLKGDSLGSRDTQRMALATYSFARSKRFLGSSTTFLYRNTLPRHSWTTIFEEHI
jgi:hypothetical protein